MLRILTYFMSYGLVSPEPPGIVPWNARLDVTIGKMFGGLGKISSLGLPGVIPWNVRSPFPLLISSDV